MSVAWRESILLHAQHAVAGITPSLDDDAVSMPLPLGRPAPQLVVAHRPFDNRSERVRALRTELLLRRNVGDRLCIALLSPRSGEGRSQLAAELAVAFAKTGRPTLLVDADLRQPRQHELFGLERRPGLADALQDGTPPMLHGVESLSSLAVLTAGRASGNPLELLADDRFANLVDDWRASFNYVLFDTPAVCDYSDALAVTTLAGQALTLSRAQHTPYQDARELLKRLAATQARVLGAVINHF